MKQVRVGRVTSSDRASAGVYEDVSGPEVERHLGALLHDYELVWRRRLVPDEQEELQAALLELVDDERCGLVITTGGTGPAKRDVTPEATRAVLEKELPGFGETMRAKSYELIATSIVSRATAGVRGSCLIVNLPGSPKAVGECLGFVGPALRHTLDILAGISPHSGSPPSPAPRKP